MPMRMRTGSSPSATRRLLSSASARCIATAAWQADAAGFCTPPGAPQNAITASLMNFVDRAAFLLDAGGDEREVLIDEFGDLDGRFCFACRGEADDVREYDGEYAFLCPRTNLAFLDQPHDQRARNIASKGPQTVEHRVERSCQA